MRSCASGAGNVFDDHDEAWPYQVSWNIAKDDIGRPTGFMITVSHPNVNQYVRALLLALDTKNQLKEFHTTLSLGPRRVAIDRRKIKQHPYREFARIVAQRLRRDRFIRQESGIFSIDAVAREFDKEVAKRLESCAAVYCYEDSALASFRAARDLGAKRYYELPIMYWTTTQKLLHEEARRYPQWEPTLLATRDSTAKLERKSAELALADLVICPSRNVQKSLPAGTRSQIAEYGCPAPIKPARAPRRGKRLRFLFVGAMTQRKGLADLFAAFRQLSRSDIELVVLGIPLLPLAFYRREFPDFSYEAPRAHDLVKHVMLSCDVLVLPSIVEGRAMAQTEALSCGLPIIVTSNAGAEDLVEQGKTGFVVPIRDPSALAERLNWIADNRDWMIDVRSDVFEKARQSGWDQYTDAILSVIL
jgi:glycosyltransferase involved in cell wall biosynthesis